jgi:ComF family protein
VFDDRDRWGFAIRRFRYGLLDLLYPSRCVGCDAPGPVWCEMCQSALEPALGETCLACFRQLPRYNPGHDCPPSSPTAVAAARYRPPLDRALTRLKYRPDERLVAALAACMRRVVLERGFRATCVVAVPLGRKRLRQRGYNQAELLGRELANSLRLPHRESAILRIRETASQVGLNPRQRRANVAGAFRANPDLVGGHSVLLVDDVQTTGSTLAACAHSLLQSGASCVLGVTVGRA